MFYMQRNYRVLLERSTLGSWSHSLFFHPRKVSKGTALNTAQTELSYAASAYDSTSIPSQPPHRWREDENRTGLRRTQLNWGYYAGLNPWQLVDGQLRGQEQTWL